MKRLIYNSVSFGMFPNALTVHDVSVIQPLTDETTHKAVEPLFHVRHLVTYDVLTQYFHILRNSHVQLIPKHNMDTCGDGP